MIQHTLDWYNGEVFEGKIIFIFGVLLIISAFICHYYGSSAGTKALTIPLLVMGLFFAGTGASMNFINLKKIKRVPDISDQNRNSYILSELTRVNGFQYLYPLSIAVCLACFLIASALLYFARNAHFQAIAVGLILLGAGLTVIDYFSKERAAVYRAALELQL